MEQVNKLTVAPVKQTAVMIRRDMLNNPEIMGALCPVERAVFLASTAKTIAEYDATALTAELNNALRWISKDVGYRVTDENEMQYLVIRTAEILKRYYPGITLKDFRMAFEMSLTGELDDFLPKNGNGQPDRNHYQQFNAEYVCKILNAYKGRRAAVFKKAYGAIPEKENGPDKRVIADLMVRQKQIFIEVLEHYRVNGRFPDGMTLITEIICCDVLSDAGLMPKIEVTIDEQKAAFQSAMNQYAREGNVGDLERLRKAGPDAEELKNKAYKYARRTALVKAIERIVNDGIEITDYIKFE